MNLDLMVIVALTVLTPAVILIAIVFRIVKAATSRNSYWNGS